MAIGGKDAFLSKVTFRRESNWYSKTKQELKDMATIEERANKNGLAYQFCKESIEADHKIFEKGYIKGATEQKAIDDVRYQKLRSLAKDMYTKAQYLSTDASHLRKACKAFYDYINCEEKKD